MPNEFNECIVLSQSKNDILLIPKQTKKISERGATIVVTVCAYNSVSLCYLNPLCTNPRLLNFLKSLEILISQHVTSH